MVENSRYYSRQVAALGHDFFHKVQNMHVLVSGLRGLGVEIVKNLILTGVGEITLHDDSIVQEEDLSYNFFITHQDVGHKTRSQSLVEVMQSLNPSIKVLTKEGKLDENGVSSYSFLVLTESNLQQAISLNHACRTKNPPIGFVYGENWGAFGFLFTDFGPEFITYDKLNEDTKRYYISNITRDNPGVVTVYDRHYLQEGTYVTFKEVQGMEEINNTPPRPVRVLSPNTFSIEDTTGYSVYHREGVVENFKIPEKLRFKSLEFNLTKPSIISEQPKRSEQLFLIIKAVCEFQKRFNKYPLGENEGFQVAQIAEEINQTCKETNALFVDAIDKDLARAVGSNAKWQHPLFATYFGALISLEVLKFTGKYSPLIQIFTKDWYHSFNHVTNIHEFLNNELKLGKGMVVGAGALGSEISKLLSQLGIPELYIIDRSKVKISDRHLFYTHDTIGQQKAEITGQKLKNKSGTRVHSICFDFGASDLNDKQWSELQWVVSAVDNHNSRNLIDQKCVWLEKPWIEGGINSTFGLCSVYLPFITSTYGESVPATEQAPSTEVLQFFPHAIEHCIEYAKEKFKLYFEDSAKDFENFLKEPSGFVSTMNENDKVLKMPIFYSYLELLQYNSYDECLKYSKERFYELFNENILKLLTTYPPELKDSEGKHFWTGFKRVPTTLPFENVDDMHSMFVESFAVLLAHILGIEKTHLGIKDIKENVVARTHSLHDLQTILSTQTPNQYLSKVRALEFDIDDKTHSTFIFSLSTLRARCYKILELDRFSTEIIAGHINGCLPSTSSMTASYVVLELLKLSQKNPKNCTFNLAANIFVEHEPENVKNNVSVEYDPQLCAPVQAFPEGFTVWDKIEIHGPLSVEGLISKFREEHCLKINLITADQVCLYNGFSEGNENMQKTFEELLGKNDGMAGLEISCQNAESGVEVCTPRIKYIFRSL